MVLTVINQTRHKGLDRLYNLPIFLVDWKNFDDLLLTLPLWKKMNWRPFSSGKRMATELSSWKKMVTEELEMLTATLEGPAEWKPELLNKPSIPRALALAYALNSYLSRSKQ
ncbi:hypothetical protein ACLB2K_026332 [Fragaria x ananassa]